MKTIGFRRRLDGLVEFGNDPKFCLALACKRGLGARDRDDTEMFEILFETRPRQSKSSLEAETSRTRLHPCVISL